MKVKFPVSDHYDGKRFFHAGPENEKTFWDILKWQFSRPKGNFPEWVENKAKPQLPIKLEDGKIAATFVNHATVLIQTKNFNFLTDPVWAERVSPVAFMGPKRIRAAGIKMEELPLIQFVVVSHNHYDHMDLQALSDLNKKFKPVFIVPLGNAKYFADMDQAQVVELDWWQAHAVTNNGVSATVTLVPVQHWSSRTLSDKREALWGGYVIEADHKKIFFTGDSGYNKEMFSKIGETFNGVDLALIPIGAYEPRWFMKDNHINPEEAVQVHLDIKAKTSMAIHYGTFQLSDELFGQPEQDLETAKKKLAVDNFVILEVGETKVF